MVQDLKELNKFGEQTSLLMRKCSIRLEPTSFIIAIKNVSLRYRRFDVFPTVYSICLYIFNAI